MRSTILLAVLTASLSHPCSAQESDTHINLGMRIQLRNTVLISHENQVENQFQIRRARINLNGSILDVNNQFKIQVGLSPSDLGLVGGVPTISPLMDYYLNFTHLRDMSLMIGQYKIPFSRERILSSGSTFLIDRSILSGNLDISRDVGATLHSQNFLGLNMMRYYLGIYTGLGRDGYVTRDIVLINPLMIIRIEAHPLGIVNSYDQVDMSLRRNPRIVIGTAYAYISDTHRLTLDMSVHCDGFSLEAATILRWQERIEEIDVGYYAQIGLLIPSISELGIAIRFSHITQFQAMGVQNEFEIATGINYFFEEHNLKLQVDWVEQWRREIEVGDHQIRLQLQVIM